MTWDDVFCNTFKALRNKTTHEVKKKLDFMFPSMPMVNACRADDFDFFQPLLDSGDLTVDQMHQAAQRYHLGKSKSGIPIFWLIDDLYQPLDGHLGTSWVSASLKAREPMLKYWRVTHCLFGLHQLSDDHCQSSIGIVDSEQSAVLLSEILPETLWLSFPDMSGITADLLEPLQDQVITIYPRADPTMTNYLFFQDFAALVRSTYPTITLNVNSTLEDRTTESQKSRYIDLLDFILE